MPENARAKLAAWRAAVDAPNQQLGEIDVHTTRIQAALADDTLPPLPPMQPLDELRLWLVMEAAIKTWGYAAYTRRLAEWFRRNPRYTTDTVPLDVLAADIRRALGWPEIAPDE